MKMIDKETGHIYEEVGRDEKMIHFVHVSSDGTKHHVYQPISSMEQYRKHFDFQE